MQQGFIERALALVLLAILIWLTLQILLPFAGPLVWSITLAVALWPLFQRLRLALGGRTGLAAACITLVLVLVVVVPLGRLALVIGSELDDAVRLGADMFRTPLPPPPEFLVQLPVIGPKVQAFWTQLMTDREPVLVQALPYLRTGAGWLVHFGAGLGLAVLQALFAVLLTGLMLANGEICADYLRRFVRQVAGPRAMEVVDLAATTVRSVALGVVGTAMIQGMLAFLGYLIAGVPSPGVLAALVFVVGLIQIPVLLAILPVVAWVYIGGQTEWSIFLLVWGLIVGTIDNFLRPWLMSQGSTMPILLIILGVVGGLIAFGPIGLFFGAVLIAVMHRLLLDWLDHVTDEVADGPPTADRP